MTKVLDRTHLQSLGTPDLLERARDWAAAELGTVPCEIITALTERIHECACDDDEDSSKLDDYRIAVERALSVILRSPSRAAAILQQLK